MQKLLMTGMLEFEPMRNVSASVADVSVIEGPARFIASFNRSLLGLNKDS